MIKNMKVIAILLVALLVRAQNPHDTMVQQEQELAAEQPPPTPGPNLFGVGVSLTDFIKQNLDHVGNYVQRQQDWFFPQATLPGELSQTIEGPGEPQNPSQPCVPCVCPQLEP